MCQDYAKIVLRHRFLQLKKTTRKEAFKVLRLKTGHCMLTQHKSKINQNTQPKCELCLVNETPIHYLLHCSIFDTQRANWMIHEIFVTRRVFVFEYYLKSNMNNRY